MQKLNFDFKLKKETCQFWTKRLFHESQFCIRVKKRKQKKYDQGLGVTVKYKKIS